MNVVVNLLITLGSLGIFLYGMKLMSEALQKIAGDKMRNILSRMTSKPLNGILTGALVTTVIQSSSATTVMVVSFVNAGLLSLAGSIAVIMGANIGTTATAWIISLLGLKFSMAELAIPIVALPEKEHYECGSAKCITCPQMEEESRCPYRYEYPQNKHCTACPVDTSQLALHSLTDHFLIDHRLTVQFLFKEIELLLHLIYFHNSITQYCSFFSIVPLS